MTAATPVVAAQALGRSLGPRVALRDVTFTLDAGERVGLVGRNGAGKSTLLRLLAGLLDPSAGSLRLFGAQPTVAPGWRAQIGYVPERPPVHERMRVGAFLEHVAALRGLADPARAAAEVADRCGLTDPGARIATLSHGYRQRVGLAQALVHRPQLLLLDEPTSGLDPVQVAELGELLAGLEATVILSSHRLVELTRIADRFLVLSAGNLLADERDADATRLESLLRGETP